MWDLTELEIGQAASDFNRFIWALSFSAGFEMVKTGDHYQVFFGFHSLYSDIGFGTGITLTY